MSGIVESFRVKMQCSICLENEDDTGFLARVIYNTCWHQICRSCELGRIQSRFGDKLRNWDCTVMVHITCAGCREPHEVSQVCLNPKAQELYERYLQNSNDRFGPLAGRWKSAEFNSSPETTVKDLLPESTGIVRDITMQTLNARWDNGMLKTLRDLLVLDDFFEDMGREVTIFQDVRPDSMIGLAQGEACPPDAIPAFPDPARNLLQKAWFAARCVYHVFMGVLSEIVLMGLYLGDQGFIGADTYKMWREQNYVQRLTQIFMEYHGLGYNGEETRAEVSVSGGYGAERRTVHITYDPTLTFERRLFRWLPIGR